MMKKVFIAIGISVVLIGVVALVLLQSKPLELKAPESVEESVRANTPVIEVKTYESADGEFRISYPSHYLLNENLIESGVGSFPASFSIASPKEEHTGTNLIESAVLVGRSVDSARVESCASAQEGETHLGSILVSESDFSIFTYEVAATGDFYQAVRYRTVINSACYEISLLMHSGSIGNYPEGTVAKFDPNIVLERLKTIFYSFEFLN